MDYQTKLQAIIDSEGLSQQALAEKIGTSFVTMNNWLNGKSKPTRKVFQENIDSLYAQYVKPEAPELERRIKYYGLRDLATSFYSKQVIEVLDDFDETRAYSDINDVLELHNVLQYVEDLALPRSLKQSKVNHYVGMKPKIHKVIATFFNSIDNKSATTAIRDVVFDYHPDLLNLLSRYKRFDSISAPVMLSTLTANNIRIWDLLENKAFVDKYDEDVRQLILSDSQNAEQLIHKYLQKRERRDVNLPPSFSPADAHDLIERYLNDKDANPNYLELIANARVTPLAGIDAKIKLLAQRRHKKWTEDFFKEENGNLMFSIEVEIVDDQDEAIEISTDGPTTKFIYSKKWLLENSDNLSSLMNFIHLFPLVNSHMLLTLPSYSARLGVIERFMKVSGADEYPEGVSFQFIDQSTLMQTMIYEKFLRSQDKDLEAVIAWYFNDYLKGTFNAGGFSYAPSSKTSTYLEKCKHGFSEMDSVIKQFKLFAENGSIDQDLLAITSDSPKYKEIPSQIAGKYVYPTDNQEIAYVIHSLFSDQSSLTYISDALKGKDFVELITSHEVKYGDFQDHQKPKLDELIRLGIIEKASKRLTFRSKRQINVLKNIFETEATSYYHYSEEARLEIDTMVTKKWLERKSTLLTESEARYFSYFLNQQDSSNGRDLRNKYLHGSMSATEKADEGKHYQTYLIFMRLMLALIIKIDDDFSTKLRRVQKGTSK